MFILASSVTGSILLMNPEAVEMMTRMVVSLNNDDEKRIMIFKYYYIGWLRNFYNIT